jgi:hypothetical protein
LHAKGIGIGLLMVGWSLMGIGGLVLGFFLLLYDTSVDSIGGRVHNVGLMQEQMIGVLLGIAGLVFGLLMSLGGLVCLALSGR